MPKRPRDVDLTREEDSDMLGYGAWNPCHLQHFTDGMDGAGGVAREAHICGRALFATPLCELRMLQRARNILGFEGAWQRQSIGYDMENEGGVMLHPLSRSD